MKLTIEQADNGYVLSYYDSDIKEKRYITIEEEATEARTTQKLLYSLIEYFCIMGSKHDTERVYVVLKNPDGEEIDNMNNICPYFDGGVCYNDKEFPNGTPTEIGSDYCDNECKYNKKHEKNNNSKRQV
jgi:hypothetical protein